MIRTNAKLEKMITDVILREGDYSNHPDDTGGETRWGITKAVARANGYTGDMRVFPETKAREIYRDIYWSGPGFDRIEKIWPRIAEELLDTGINMGPAVAARALQRALNCLNRQGRDYPDITIDNRIGPRTAGAAQAFKDRRGTAAEGVIMKVIEGLQVARYVEITEGRQPNEQFFFGWIDHRIGNVK